MQTAYVCSTIPYPRSHLIHSLYYFTFLNYMKSTKIDFRAVLIKGIDKDFILRYILPVFFFCYSVPLKYPYSCHYSKNSDQKFFSLNLKFSSLENPGQRCLLISSISALFCSFFFLISNISIFISFPIKKLYPKI